MACISVLVRVLVNKGNEYFFVGVVYWIWKQTVCYVGWQRLLWNDMFCKCVGFFFADSNYDLVLHSCYACYPTMPKWAVYWPNATMAETCRAPIPKCATRIQYFTILWDYRRNRITHRCWLRLKTHSDSWALPDTESNIQTSLVHCVGCDKIRPPPHSWGENFSVT